MNNDALIRATRKAHFLLAGLALCLPLAVFAQYRSEKLVYIHVSKIEMEFDSESGRDYQIQSSADLQNWTTEEQLTGTGGMMSWFTDKRSQPNYFQLKIVSPSTPPGMVFIPAGSFEMGDPYEEGNADELPVHTVYVSNFYMDMSEVTKSLWDEVRTWGGSNGYTDLDSGSAAASDHPVHSATITSMVKWCNARSEYEGRTPVYYEDAAQTVVFRTGTLGGLENVVVKWNGNGYRLPTEAEWERAARDDLVGHHFPWSSLGGTYTEHIDAGDANYDNNIGGTTPVGSYPPNGFGLYDMAGNLWDICWDQWRTDYYESSPPMDPKGKPSGTGRTMTKRGGGYNNEPFYLRCSARAAATGGGDTIGFRTVIGHLLNETPGFELVFETNTGRDYEIETSADLVNWIHLDHEDGTGGQIQYIASWWNYPDPVFFRVGELVPAPSGMEYIPAGSFEMGYPEFAVHTEYTDAFYMDIFETSKVLWDSVYTWATANGYTFDNAGSGEADDHPVHTINWYDIVKWANARSEMEGRTPCYYTDSTHAAVYRTGQIHLADADVQWDADGYRLPTEKEWEKAARGGLINKNYPWGDTIDGSMANYNGSGDPYEGAPVETTPVGYYDGNQVPAGVDMANGFGLYDMAGNIREWCWDFPSTKRVTRDGAWSLDETVLLCSHQSGSIESTVWNHTGFRLVISAPPEGMAYIPAGSFDMGDTYGIETQSLPVHTVTLNAYFIERLEVTMNLWDEVQVWAVANGYDLTPAEGSGPDHPVVMKDWYDAVKWANARSEMEGLTPCYYTGASHTEIYRTGKINLSNDCVKWNAKGYRLPTEAEWERAARGGLDGHHFPWDSFGGDWSGHIDGSMANYNGSGDPYEGQTYETTPVGYYNGNQIPSGSDMVNGFGLYDMAGNVWEWVWDWWGAYDDAPLENPKGPVSGSDKNIRGGGWIHDSYAHRVYTRNVTCTDCNYPSVGLRLVISASAPPDEMAYIPAGSFDMGDHFGEESEALPVHSVTVSDFYMGTYEVTYALWQSVYTWATANGYAFDNAGAGTAADHPVHSINWYDIVKWCNAKSEMEWLTPCYYTDSSLSTVYRTGNLDLASDCVIWDTTGYRLPTEAEWEKAARGGLVGKRYPWGDSINCSYANYNRCVNQTTPVGSYAPNGYGLYDMSGNIFERCWDWYDSSYYSYSPATDPKGPSSGTTREVRGQDYIGDQWEVQCAHRNDSCLPGSFGGEGTGFRLARSRWE